MATVCGRYSGWANDTEILAGTKLRLGASSKQPAAKSYKGTSSKQPAAKSYIPEQTVPGTNGESTAQPKAQLFQLRRASPGGR